MCVRWRRSHQITARRPPRSRKQNMLQSAQRATLIHPHLVQVKFLPHADSPSAKPNRSTNQTTETPPPPAAQTHQQTCLLYLHSAPLGSSFVTSRSIDRVCLLDGLEGRQRNKAQESVAMITAGSNSVHRHKTRQKLAPLSRLFSDQACLHYRVSATKIICLNIPFFPSVAFA